MCKWVSYFRSEGKSGYVHTDGKQQLGHNKPEI